MPPRRRTLRSTPRTTKYDQYGPKIVGSVVGPHAKAVTIRLVPQGEGAPALRSTMEEREVARLPDHFLRVDDATASREVLAEAARRRG
jgi:hypothetical protein